MSSDLSAVGSLSFFLDIIPVIVIIVFIIAFAFCRHKYLKEKRELNMTIAACENSKYHEK